jgi:hypothetical protein
MPSDATYTFGYNANAAAYTDVTLDGTGYVRVNVSSTCVTVDYVKSYIPGTSGSEGHVNGEIGYSYTIGSNCALSTTNTVAPSKVSIYPNPVKDTLYISNSDLSVPHHYELISMLGQTIVEFSSDSLNTSNLPSGVYFLKIDGFNTITKKIIVNH